MPSELFGFEVVEAFGELGAVGFDLVDAEGPEVDGVADVVDEDVRERFGAEDGEVNGQADEDCVRANEHREEFSVVTRGDFEDAADG